MSESRAGEGDGHGERHGAAGRARAVGINHVALEVGDIDEALRFYGSFLEFELRSRSEGMAFIDLGDQFIALARSSDAHSDRHRHFGLVVDDVRLVRECLRQIGVALSEEATDFRDPWGNRVQIVEYAQVQFTKASPVLRHLGVRPDKSPQAIAELHGKGIAVRQA